LVVIGDGSVSGPNRSLQMIVAVFRSRLNPGALEEYGPMARRMSELAKGIAGYISHKGFVAEDGERVTIVEFESEEALRAWQIDREDGQHVYWRRDAQQWHAGYLDSDSAWASRRRT